MDPVSPSIADLDLPSGVEGLRKKDVKRLLDMSRPLDAWERYRALNDAMDEAYDVIDMSIREARFALLLMGGLNAVVIVAATRSDLVAVLHPQQRVWAGSLLGIYGICAVYFLLQAIEALRPGKFRPQFGGWSEDSEDFPKRVRYYEDVIERDVQSHWQAWRDVQVGQLNAELAVQLHSMCIKSNMKRNALRRLYAGLRVMTFLVAALVVLFVYASWT
jgi:uncharacterized membrane protein YuzA (DUF378 family)